MRAGAGQKQPGDVCLGSTQAGDRPQHELLMRRGGEAPDGTVAAYAGCGIVHDSVPADELAETDIKFRPIVEAFGG